ncbi:hypothetical protein [Streptomyces sp. NEAU-L66]|uniref:hypothetical protein n=1 Tax=Streptomyces sp. NEAU-L66 TaxID=3390812 RepID=UPI0039C71993
MTALTQEKPVTTPEATTPGPDLDEVLWQAWKAMEEGPAKGFVIGEAITGPARGA